MRVFRRRLRAIGRVAVMVALVLAIGAVVLSLWLLPPIIAAGESSPNGTFTAEQSQAIAAVRQSMLFAAGGLIAIITLVFTWRRDDISRRSADLDRDANFTTRYTEAIRQLGDDSVAIRLGGVYALERVAADSLRDRQTVLDVLGAYLRHSSKQTDFPDPVPVDTMAAVTVLGRVTQMSEPVNQVVLANTDMRGADLAEADLRGASLSNAWLKGARLRKATLRYANLEDADLEGADLVWADLRGTNLKGANLRDANIGGATFDKRAVGDEHTVWPDGQIPWELVAETTTPDRIVIRARVKRS